MFCKKCGNQLADNTNFCQHCGAAQEASVEAPAAVVQPTPTAASPSRGKRIGGIVMLVLGGLSILGSIANDYFYNIIHNGLNGSDFVTVTIQIVLVVGGILLICKSGK